MTPGAATGDRRQNEKAPVTPLVVEALKQSPAAVVILDRDARVLDSNDRAAKLLGLTRGASLADALGVSARDLARLWTALEGPLDLPGQTKDGAARLLLVPVPLPDPAHRAVFIHPLAGRPGETPPAPEGAAGVTNREREVLRLLAAGKSTVAIAQELGIARTTARNHIQAIIGKLDAHSRLEAVAKARELGLA